MVHTCDCDQRVATSRVATNHARGHPASTHLTLATAATMTPRHRHLLLATILILALGPQLPVTRALVRRGAGVVLVKISAVTNAEGRDAAGSCCSGAAAPGTVCPGPCYSMMKVCASQVRNDRCSAEYYLPPSY